MIRYGLTPIATALPRTPFLMLSVCPRAIRAMSSQLMRPDAHEEKQDRAPEDDHEQDQHEHVGNGHQHVDHAHHRAVEPAAEVACRGAVERTDHNRDHRAEDADHQRYAGALHRAREQVAAERVHPEIVAVGNGGAPCSATLPSIAQSISSLDHDGHQVAEDGEGGDEQQDDEARHGRPVAEEADAGIAPEGAAAGHALDIGGGERADGASSEEERRHVSTGFAGRSRRRGDRPAD